MKILQAEVTNFGAEDGFVYPRIRVLVDTIPQAFVFQRKEDIYWGESEGLIRHFHYAGPGKGMQGAKFEVELDSGELIQVIGPWPTDTESVNKLFPWGVDVELTDDPQTWEEGGIFFQATFTIKKALEALDKCLAGPVHWRLLAQFQQHTAGIRVIPILAKDIGGSSSLIYDEEVVKYHLQQMSYADLGLDLSEVGRKLRGVLERRLVYASPEDQEVLRYCIQDINRVANLLYYLTPRQKEVKSQYVSKPTVPTQVDGLRSVEREVDAQGPTGEIEHELSHERPKEDADASTLRDRIKPNPDLNPEDYDAIIEQTEELEDGS